MNSIATGRRVLLTGATGVMGGCALEAILRAQSNVGLRVAVLPGDRGIDRIEALKTLGPFDVRVGDLTNAAFVHDCVRGMDMIVHIAALVSPMADEHPERTMAVNVGSIEHMLRAITELGQRDTTALVGIGSIAETGSRMPPLHWGRVGDPVITSAFDHYAVSKVRAERLLVESGLKRWAWLRQTAIASPSLLRTALDPIVYHQPLNNCLEWVTDRDAGVLVRNLVCESLPESFWRRVYNIGGGRSMQLTGYQTLCTMLAAMGSGTPEELFEPWWFATQNFHGHWYTDADELEAFLHFRTQRWDDFLRDLEHATPRLQKVFVPKIPGAIKRVGTRWLARRPRGSLHWIEHRQREQLIAYFGSEDAWRTLPRSWSEVDTEGPSRVASKPLSRGFHDTDDPSTLDPAALREAAKFRGGVLLDDAPADGVTYTPRRWRCAFGHEFRASLYLVLLAGHFCPHCDAPPWRNRELAARSPFLAQVVTTAPCG